MSPEDQERLRVRLSDLPGFDPVGLWVDNGSEPEGYLVLHQDETEVLVHTGDSDDLPWWWTKTGPEEPTVTALHASTRDRLARWVADRLDRDVLGPRPSLCPLSFKFHYDDYGDGVWLIQYETGPATRLTIPVWSGFRTGDGRLLPDGSRYVDAAALAAVAVHLGGQQP